MIVGGVVSGTWLLTDDQVVTAWFGEAGSPTREALAGEVARLATILDQPWSGDWSGLAGRRL